MAPEPADLLAPFQPLVGQWRGEGRGLWDATPPFRYLDELTIEPVPDRPLLRVQERTRAAVTGSVSHLECGFMRLFEGAEVELLIVSPAGYTEIHRGRLVGRLLRLLPVDLGVAERARPVTRVERQLELRDGVLHSSVAIAVGLGPVARHVESVLERVI